VDSIGLMLYRLLKKAKQTSIVKATASKVIQTYLSLTDSTEADGYFDALVRQKCIISNASTDCSPTSKYLAGLRSGNSVSTASAYRISLEKEVEFSIIRKGKRGRIKGKRGRTH